MLTTRRLKVHKELQEESKALTTAVVDSLQQQPSTQADVYTATALRFAKQDQHVEGLPLQPFDVPALLFTLTNTNTASIVAGSVPEAEKQVLARFEKENNLLKAARSLQDRLLELGILEETRQQEKRRFWARAFAWLTVPSVGLIALIVFCPFALPILGRLLGALVHGLPRLAGFLGVVSVRAFDAVVRGVEKWKTQTETLTGAPDAASPVDGIRRPGDQALDPIATLHAALGREMDAPHKALVRARKS